VRQNLLNNPIVIVLLLISVFLLNTISSTFFVKLTLAGVVFLAFLNTLEKRYYNSFILVVISFLVIESNQGLFLFSLIGFSFLSYITIIPYLDKFFTIQSVRNFVHIFYFYFVLAVIYSIFINFDPNIIISFVFNFILDILILGFIL
jgi:hypothetical protein